jgi:hypothetical protein
MDAVSETDIHARSSTIVNQLDNFNSQSATLDGGEIHDIYSEYSEFGESGRLSGVYRAELYDHKYLMNFSTLLDN